jgi:hypothetical protein
MLQDSISNPLPKVEGTWFVKNRDGWKELETPAAKHPITPPPELVQQWLKERTLLKSQPLAHHYLATRAAQWGWDQREPEIQAVADQELEACCDVLENDLSCFVSADLRAARRPKPPSLKEQALEALDHIEFGYATGAFGDTIRRALEALPDD